MYIEASEDFNGIYSGGVPASLIELAGGGRVWGELPERYNSISKEQFITRPIDLFIIPNESYADNGLETLFALFPDMPASQNRNGIRTSDLYAGGATMANTVTVIARALYPEAF
jgi:ABC-type Fe3+-hydroxamate transport system substrate-binding protein